MSKYDEKNDIVFNYLLSLKLDLIKVKYLCDIERLSYNDFKDYYDKFEYIYFEIDDVISYVDALIINW